MTTTIKSNEKERIKFMNLKEYISTEAGRILIEGRLDDASVVANMVTFVDAKGE